MKKSCRRCWPHVRGLLITLHILAITVMAWPAPGEGMDRAAWQDANVQEEFALWTARCRSVGIQITQEEFEERLWRFAVRYTEVQSDLQSPFALYYDYCGTTQSWRMFAGPQRYPARLEVELEEAGTWRPIYVQRDSTHAWQAEHLDHYRLRPALYRFSWGYPGFDDLCRWLARRAAADFPDARRLRVALHKFHTLSPEEVRAGDRPETWPALSRELALEEFR